MRISSAGPILLLAACTPGAGEDSLAATDADDRIECALGGAATFVPACQVEQSKDGGVPILVVRHPDGSFRRFEITADGTGVAAADGAQRAEVSLRGNGIEVAVGADRYRLPATIAGDDRR